MRPSYFSGRPRSRAPGGAARGRHEPGPARGRLTEEAGSARPALSSILSSRARRERTRPRARHCSAADASSALILALLVRAAGRRGRRLSPPAAAAAPDAAQIDDFLALHGSPMTGTGRHLRRRGPGARRRPGLPRRHHRRRDQLRPVPVLRGRRPVHVQRLQLVLRRHVAAERLRLLGRGHRAASRRASPASLYYGAGLYSVQRHRASVLPGRHRQLGRQRHLLHDPARRQPRRHAARRRVRRPPSERPGAAGARRLGEAVRRAARGGPRRDARASRSPTRRPAGRPRGYPAHGRRPRRRQRRLVSDQPVTLAPGPAAGRGRRLAARHGRPLERLDRGRPERRRRTWSARRRPSPSA